MNHLNNDRVFLACFVSILFLVFSFHFFLPFRVRVIPFVSLRVFFIVLPNVFLQVVFAFI